MSWILVKSKKRYSIIHLFLTITYFGSSFMFRYCFLFFSIIAAIKEYLQWTDAHWFLICRWITNTSYVFFYRDSSFQLQHNKTRDCENCRVRNFHQNKVKPSLYHKRSLSSLPIHYFFSFVPHKITTIIVIRGQSGISCFNVKLYIYQTSFRKLMTYFSSFYILLLKGQII